MSTPRPSLPGLGRWWPLLVLLALALLLAAGLGRDPRKLPSVLIGRPAPDFALPPLEQVLRAAPGPQSSAELATPARWAGRVWLLNVFASWCSGCNVEHPHWLAAARTVPGLTLVGLAYKDEPQATRQWLARQGDPYTAVLVDRDGRVGIDYGVYGVPETFVIDAAGVVRHRHAGPIDEHFMARHVLPLLQASDR